MSITAKHSLMVEEPVEVKCPDWCNTESKVMKYTCVWTIHTYRKIASFEKGKCVRSPTFMLGNSADEEHEAYIAFYPKGDPTASDELYTSIYLQFVSYVPPTIKGRLKFDFQGSNASETMITMETLNSGVGWGFSKWVRRTMSVDNNARIFNCTIYLPTQREATENAGQRNEMKVCFSYDDPSGRFYNSNTQVLGDLCSLLDTASFSDVAIRVEGRELRAHKFVLAARSPVFRAMLEANMAEKRNSVVNVTDVGFETMEHLLRLIYSGRSENLEDAAEEVMVAADKYGVEDVKARCGEILSQQVSVDNAARLLLLADRHLETRLIGKVVSFIRRHKNEVKATEGWKEFQKVRSDLIIQAFVEN